MSRNLVEIIRRHHELGAPTALEVLKDALADHGEITDDDRRLASERSGLPEAAVHGVSSFYDDLLQPRGRRHVRVCTACFAATADAHVAALREALGCELTTPRPQSRGPVMVCFVNGTPARRAQPPTGRSRSRSRSRWRPTESLAFRAS